MKFLSFVALLALPAPGFSFVSQKTAFRTSNIARRGSSSLKMVADDAKVVLITGASQGLGQAIAREIAKFGQKIVVNYIAGCEEGAEETVQQVKDMGGDAVAIQVSV